MNYGLRITGYVLLLLFVTGCAEITPPNPVDVITHPFGQKPPVRIGTTKDEVKAKWGSPDRVISLGAAKLGAAREEWVYYGQVPGIPLDYKYLSKTKHLYFEGNVLTKYTSD